ncbi:MAG: metal ABC transporter substrate-binding protein [Spirochaetaceae bacterium]|nr:metal ABC transporter substrate-binding protein [Spirochaetaceae bacterium]
MYRCITRALVALIVLLAGTLAWGEPSRESADTDGIAAVATTNIVGDIVATVGGDRLSLYVMLPLDADPHAFRATPRDARQVADADVVFINGAGLEADFLGDLIASAAPRLIVDLSAHLSLRRMMDGDDEEEHEDEHGHDDDEEDHDHGEFDAHVWMDPTLVAVWAAEIAEALAEIDPEHGADYARRADTFVGELDGLDAWIRDQVATVPHDRRILVTDHEVFGYFADRYGFTVLDAIIPGFSTVSEPSARHLADLREAISEHAIPAIFVGTTVNPQVARVVADDLGIEVVAVYTGSLSEPDGPAASYLEFMRTNVERIVAALSE